MLGQVNINADLNAYRISKCYKNERNYKWNSIADTIIKVDKAPCGCQVRTLGRSLFDIS